MGGQSKHKRGHSLVNRIRHEGGICLVDRRKFSAQWVKGKPEEVLALCALRTDLDRKVLKAQSKLVDMPIEGHFSDANRRTLLTCQSKDTLLSLKKNHFSLGKCL